jgi:hypothetical protein
MFTQAERPLLFSSKLLKQDHFPLSVLPGAASHGINGLEIANIALNSILDQR